MTTASDILKQALEAMGADAWVVPEMGIYELWEPMSPYARPAWRDGGCCAHCDDGVEGMDCTCTRPDKWFVLPDGWEWDGYNWVHGNNHCVVTRAGFFFGGECGAA